MVMVFPKPELNYSMDGYLKELLDTYKDAVYNKNTSFVGVTDGRSGMGKTTLTGQVGQYLDNNFDLSKVHFNPQSFLEGLSKAKKGDFICFDEAMALSSRATLTEINRAVVIAMSQIRSKNIFVWFNVNSIFDLDRNLALSRADVLLHTYGPNIFTRGSFCAFFKARDGIERIKQLYLIGKKLYDYGKPKANFYGSFPMKFVFNEDEYEAKKQREVNEFLLKSAGRREQKYKEATKNLIEYIENEKGLSKEDIAMIAKISRATVYNLFK